MTDKHGMMQAATVPAACSSRCPGIPECAKYEGGTAVQCPASNTLMTPPKCSECKTGFNLVGWKAANLAILTNCNPLTWYHNACADCKWDMSKSRLLRYELQPMPYHQHLSEVQGSVCLGEWCHGFTQYACTFALFLALP